MAGGLTLVVNNEADRGVSGHFLGNFPMNGCEDGGCACGVGLACGGVGEEPLNRGGRGREVWGVSASADELDLGLGLAFFAPLK